MAEIIGTNEFYYTGVNRIDHQQILSMYADSYVKLLFLCGFMIFLYVFWNNFITKRKNTITIKGETIDIDELAILPACFIFLLTGTYYLGWTGV